MLFNSLAFAVFFPVVLAGYYVLSRRAQNLWLLVASCVFYGWWDPRFLLLLAFCASVDYFCALGIDAAPHARRRKLLLFLSVGTNLGTLAFFKYCNFFVDSAQHLLGTFGLAPQPLTLQIILPVGISFYTFQAISYTVNVYRGVMKPCREPLTYALYISYFPQLLAGPIERANTLLPQLQRQRQVGWKQVQEGLILLLLGYLKKVGIADALAPLVDVRFQNPQQCSGADLLLALYLFALQIYCDFSGYSDIARGVSKLLGIELMVNFDRPYFSTSITEFWRRWHISLSTWLRDYLYIPLGGNRRGALRTYGNLLLTMLIGGLWHGASWTFVVWGGMHGLYLAVHKAWRGRWPSEEDEGHPGPLLRLANILLTFHLVTLTWIFFRAPSFAIAWSYLRGIATWAPSGGVAPLRWLDPRILILVAVWLTLELAQERGGGDTAPLAQRPWLVRGVIYAALILTLLVCGGLDAQVPFIYFQF